MTGAEYLAAMAEFISILQMDLMSTMVVTKSLSLTSVTTTLTSEQVTKLTSALVFFSSDR